MHWDLGLQGVGALSAYSLAFGLIAQLALWRSTTHWLWLIAAGTFFVAGLLISEVWFGSAVEGELQPNIDGLSRDEALLAFIPASIAVWITWAFGQRHVRHRPVAKQRKGGDIDEVHHGSGAFPRGRGL